MLPPGVYIIPIEDRDPDHYYMVGPGQTMIFPFIVPAFSSILIETIHVLDNSQDWSLSAWFSSKPLDDMEFARDDSLNEHKLTRVQRGYEIWDKLILTENDTRIGLMPGTYYLNIKNLQNRNNTYKAQFSS
jgi:hypothetical protein